MFLILICKTQTPCIIHVTHSEVLIDECHSFFPNFNKGTHVSTWYNPKQGLLSRLWLIVYFTQNLEWISVYSNHLTLYSHAKKMNLLHFRHQLVGPWAPMIWVGASLRPSAIWWTWYLWEPHTTPILMSYFWIAFSIHIAHTWTPSLLLLRTKPTMLSIIDYLKNQSRVLCFLTK